MDTFDDIESTNAHAWDEETRGRRSPRAIAEPVSRPRRHGNGTPLRRVHSGTFEAPQTIPGRPVMDGGTEQNDRPNLTQREYQRHKHPARPVKDQIAKKVEWAKQNAVNTKRKQDHLDREAKKAAKSEKYLGLPDDDNFPAEGYYFWSDSSIDPISLLGENLQLLDEIRSSYEVYIDFLEALSCIRLRSKTRRNIESGVAGIKAKIQHARADSAALGPMYIVEPPAVHAMKSKVSPGIQDSQQVEKTSTAVRAVILGSTPTPEQLSMYKVEREAVIKHNQERVFGRMVSALVGLGPLNKPLRMRSNLGEIQLLQVRKEFKREGCSFQTFASTMEEPRTTANFERILGEATFTGRILELFSTGSSLFEPTDSLTSRLADVEAKHSLEVIAHVPSRQSVWIEADIDMVQGGVQGNLPKTRDAAWQIGAINYYQYRHKARKTRLTIGMLSLECNFDSCLEIVTKEAMLQPIKDFQNFLGGTTISGTSTFATEKVSFNYPAIRLLVPQGLEVEKLRVRSAFQYRLRNTSYIVEVAVYHEWKGGETKQEPLTNCAISLYHKDWDLLMTPDEGIEGPRGLDMKSLFPDESGIDDGLSGFLAHVQTLQWFVNLV